MEHSSVSLAKIELKPVTMKVQVICLCCLVLYCFKPFNGRQELKIQCSCKPFLSIMSLLRYVLSCLFFIAWPPLYGCVSICFTCVAVCDHVHKGEVGYKIWVGLQNWNWKAIRKIIIFLHQFISASREVIRPS